MNRTTSMFRFLKTAASTSALVLCLVLSAVAQRTTGTLRGQVLDPQGAAVVNAKVTVVNPATGVSQAVTTSSAGTWNFPAILPGTYTVTVEAAGFRKFSKTNVPVLADQDNVADARLSLGSASETVEVVAGTAQVETTSSDLNNNFDTNQILNVPVTGGTVYSALNLAILAPNTIAQPGGTTGVGGSIGGTRPRDNNFTVDGVDDNNLGVTGPNSTVIFDAVDEFTLQTNQFSAEYGHSAGGQFNLVTKSGTNAYHGSGEWYAQNRNFNSLDNLTKAAILSNTPGVTRQPPYDNNRFGGTFGGPIVKDKLFFFGAYEYTDLHGAGSPTNLTAPTSTGLSALQAMAADPAVAAVLANFPVAPASDGTGVTVNGQFIPTGPLTIISPILNHEHDVQANVDYHKGRHQFGTRFLLNQSKQIFPANDTQAIFNQDLLVRNRKIALTDTWSVSNTVVNDLRLQYAYFSEFFANHCPTCPHQDVTILDLGDTTIGLADPQWQKQTTYQVSDNLSWVKGKHSLKFGGQYNHFIYPQFFLPRSNGDNWYSSTQEFINDQKPSQPGRTLRGAGSGSFLGTQSLIAGFIQDDVKVTPRLTLNLGVRYEFWTNPVGDKLQALNAISSVPGVITFGVPKTDKNNIGPRIGFAYDPTGSGRTSIRGGFGISYDVKFQNFASITLPPQIQSEMNTDTACLIANPPAWCSAPNGAGFLAAGGLPAVLTPPTDQAGARALTSSYIDDTVMPKIMTWSLGVQHEVAKNSTIEIRYLGTRGLELPIQFRRNFISYFDAGGTTLPTYLNAASVPTTWTASTPTDTNYYLFDPNQYSKYGFAGNITSDPSVGSSIYHAGSINFTHRAGHGISLNTNYTYSHTISDSDNEFHTSALNPRRAQDSTRLGQDRSNSDLDVRHKFALSLVYDLPQTHSTNGFVRAILDGYGIGSSVLAQSGQPVTIQSGIDSNGNGDSAGDRAFFNPAGTGFVPGESSVEPGFALPVQTQGDVFPVCEGPGGATYVGSWSVLTAPSSQGCNVNIAAPLGFDPAVGYTPVHPNDKYVITGPGSMSNLGRNSYRSPGFWTWNLSAHKNIYFTESRYLQVSASVFNVLNHPNYALSNGNVFSNSGVTTALATPDYVLPFASQPNFLDPHQFGGGIRSMILAAKFVF